MRLLLDTHVFLWWISEDVRLSTQASELIADPENDVLFSAASGWEIAIKARLGRLAIPTPLDEFMVGQIRTNGFTVLPIELSHTLAVYSLPEHHRDPFDRLLLAQAQAEDLVLISNDSQFTAYADQVRLFW